MDQKNQKSQEKNLSELMEFDFDDILMDDLPGESGQASQRGSENRPRDTQSAEAAASQKTQQAEKEKKLRRKRGLKVTFDIATWVKDLVLAGIVLWVLLTFVATSIQMPDSSMSPTVAAGEHFVVSKLVYRFKEPDRGDVVAIEYENSNGHTMETISRVVGLPGDRVVIDEQGTITINGQKLSTSYSDGTTTYVPGQTVFPYTVPEDCYFVLDDNPAGTTDSRFASIGAISKSDIIGSVIFCYWPSSSWRPVG